MGEGDNEVCKLEPCPQQALNHFFSESEHLPLFRNDEDDELLNEDNNDHKQIVVMHPVHGDLLLPILNHNIFFYIYKSVHVRHHYAT